MEIDTLAPMTVAAVARTCATDPAAVGAAIESAFGEIMPALGAAGVAPAGPPLTAYYDYSEKEMSFDVCMPIAAEDAARLKDKLKVYETESGKALKAIHKGPYPQLGETYKAVEAHITDNGLQPKSVCYEIYVTDPGETPEAELLTEIWFPLK